MLAKSNWLSTNILNKALKNTNWTHPSTVYLTLYLSNPTAADTGTEVATAGTGYVRLPITFGSVVDVTLSLYDIKTGAAETLTRKGLRSAADVTHAIATADWGLVSHIGLRTAATGGNLLYFGPVTNPRTILANDRLIVRADDIVITEG